MSSVSNWHYKRRFAFCLPLFLEPSFIMSVKNPDTQPRILSSPNPPGYTKRLINIRFVVNRCISACTLALYQAFYTVKRIYANHKVLFPCFPIVQPRRFITPEFSKSVQGIIICVSLEPYFYGSPFRLSKLIPFAFIHSKRRANAHKKT